MLRMKNNFREGILHHSGCGQNILGNYTNNSKKKCYYQKDFRKSTHNEINSLIFRRIFTTFHIEYFDLAEFAHKQPHAYVQPANYEGHK